MTVTVEMQRENTPLLPETTFPAVRKSQQRQRRHRIATVALAGSALLIGGTVALWNSAPARLVGQEVRAAQARVSRGAGGYAVDMTGGRRDAAAMTFAELASFALLPWYEASRVAVISDGAWAASIGPETVAPIRKVLLIARDMLDVFSPVFPDQDKGHRYLAKAGNNNDRDRSLWKELRTLYRRGYEEMGELHDLLGLDHSKNLLEARVERVNVWREEFISFQETRRIRRYLYGGGIDPRGCYYHRASHLFWADSEREGLPRGEDPGPASLRQLASVQLGHSINYLDVIETYATVLPKEHELNFHNLRKGLRIFVDEYRMFGNVLVPDAPDVGPAANGTSTEQYIRLLDSAQVKLGHIHDEWTAREVYAEDDASAKTAKKQSKLAEKTDRKWSTFLAWEADVDLRGTMENVLERLQK